MAVAGEAVGHVLLEQVAPVGAIQVAVGDTQRGRKASMSGAASTTATSSSTSSSGVPGPTDLEQMGGVDGVGVGLAALEAQLVGASISASAWSQSAARDGRSPP